MREPDEEETSRLESAIRKALEADEPDPPPVLLAWMRAVLSPSAWRAMLRFWKRDR